MNYLFCYSIVQLQDTQNSPYNMQCMYTVQTGRGVSNNHAPFRESVLEPLVPCLIENSGLWLSVQDCNKTKPILNASPEKEMKGKNICFR